MILLLRTAAVLCLLYYVVIVIYSGITCHFAWIWIALAAMLAGASCIIAYDSSHPGGIPGWMTAFAALFTVGAAVAFVVLCGKVLRGMRQQPAAGLDYVVVLGAHVRGNVPSKALQKRLDKAYQYAVSNPETKLILSGGKGFGEDISEARCMAEYLTRRGLEKERLIWEDKSTDTRENLLFSDRLTNCSKAETGVLSNNFHIYRAVRLARKLGYQKAQGIPAPADPIMQAHNVMREIFALVKEKLCGHI